MARIKAFIGFPEGILREKPVRLAVLASREGWFAVNKPPGLLCQAHPWFAAHSDITRAIRAQAKAGKGELERLNISDCHFVCGPEFEEAGPALFAKNKSTGGFLKNSLGSDQIKFTYRFLTAAKITKTEMFCELPVARHRDKPISVISHKFGKKSSTRFRKINDCKSLSHWEAVSLHPRLNQIRLHAAEMGIPVLGDREYTEAGIEDQDRMSRNSLKLATRFSGLAFYLVEMDLSAVLGENCKLAIEPPRSIATLLEEIWLRLTGIIEN